MCSVNNTTNLPVLPGQSVFLYFDDPLRSDANGIFRTFADLGFTSVFYIAKNYDGRTAFKNNYADTAHEGLGIACDLSAKHHLRVYATLMVLNEGYTGAFGDGGMSTFFAQHSDGVHIVDRTGQSIRDVPVRSDRGISYYCCPSSQEVRERFVAIAVEAATNYNIYGIHLDCVRYPTSGDFCYCERCKRTFRQQTGEDLLQASHQKLREWRCSVMKELVEYICSAVRLSVPDKSISALVWRAPECFELGQDWVSWPVDFVTPMYYMDYYWETLNWVYRAVLSDEKLGKTIVPAMGGDSAKLSRRILLRLCEMHTMFKSKSMMLGQYDTEHLLKVLQFERWSRQLFKDIACLKQVVKRKLRRRL
jgi:hypothetical protein